MNSTRNAYDLHRRVIAMARELSFFNVEYRGIRQRSRRDCRDRLQRRLLSGSACGALPRGHSRGSAAIRKGLLRLCRSMRGRGIEVLREPHIRTEDVAAQPILQKAQ